MTLNRLQVQILKKLSSDSKLEMEEYLCRFSKEYIGRRVERQDELTEQEADTWITKAYLQSLG
jgi:hypothetical protein